jgi:hypothetical protein
MKKAAKRSGGKAPAKRRAPESARRKPKSARGQAELARLLGQLALITNRLGETSERLSQTAERLAQSALASPAATPSIEAPRPRAGEHSDDVEVATAMEEE